MRVLADLREWIPYALGPPGPLGAFLDDRPTVEAHSSDIVYDMLDRALVAATRKVPSEFLNDLAPLNPFRSTHDLWVLGWPAEVRLGAGKIHLIDSLGDIAAKSDSITLVLRPRDDIHRNSASLHALSERFGDAVGLRPMVRDLYVGLVDKVLEALVDERLTPKFREALAVLDDFRRNRDPSSVPDLELAGDTVDARKRGDEGLWHALDILETLRKPIGEHLADPVVWIALTTVGTMLGRHEIASYNDFSMMAGAECIRNYWVPFSYPSELWQKIEEGEGPTFLSEIGSRLWRFSILRNRIKRTEEMLAQGGTVDSLVGKSLSLSPPSFFKADEIANWWFEKETIALRYYLVGIFSFPESFLGLLKGVDVSNYMKEVKSLLGFEAEPKDFLRWFPGLGADEVRLTDVLGQIVEEVPGGVKVVFELSKPNDFIRVQRTLQRGKSQEARARLIFLYNSLRNVLVHGVKFRQAEVGALLFQHGGKRYIVDYDSLALAYHLLPVVVGRLYEAHRGRQT